MIAKGIKVQHFLGDQQIYTPPNMIADPKISIILPTYCRGNNGLLRRSIHSVLTQTFRDFELIIVDDGSVDDTMLIIKELQMNDPRIVYIRHDRNSGLPALRVNEGIMISRGNYIAYQFDDDVWYPTALEVLYNRSMQLTSPSLVFGKCKLNVHNHQNQLTSSLFIGTPIFSLSQLDAHNLIANNAVLHPRQFIEESGGYDCHILLRRYCDWDLWRRWAKKYPLVHVNALVSEVFANQEQSIGRTVTGSSLFVTLFSQLERNSLLTTKTWENYLLDDMTFLRGQFANEWDFLNFVSRWFNSEIRPWYHKVNV